MTPRFRHGNMLSAIALVGALALAAGAGWLLYSVFNERAALAAIEATYIEANEKNSSASAIRALLRDTEADRARISALTAGRDPVAVIRTLEEAALAAGATLTVDAVTGGGASVDPTLSSILVALHANGSFVRLHHFLSLLGSLPFPAMIERAKLEKSDAGWEVRLIMRAFVETQ